MNKEQKESLSRAKAHVASLGYMSIETTRVRTEDVESILSIIEDQNKLLNSLKSDLQDLKEFMIENNSWEHFEGGMIQSLIMTLED